MFTSSVKKLTYMIISIIIFPLVFVKCIYLSYNNKLAITDQGHTNSGAV